MVKSIVGVIVGYIAVTLFAFAVCTCAYLGLGVERVFEPESYDVSTIWIVIMIGVALVGGVLGGLICAAISKSKGACMAFAIVILVVGIIAAVVTGMKEHPTTPRSGDVSNLEAMTKAQTPAWLCYVNPALGAVGVMLGARMKKLPTA
jgi:FtsH-binding integral membrane protein